MKKNIKSYFLFSKLFFIQTEKWMARTIGGGKRERTEPTVLVLVLVFDTAIQIVILFLLLIGLPFIYILFHSFQPVLTAFETNELRKQTSVYFG